MAHTASQSRQLVNPLRAYAVDFRDRLCLRLASTGEVVNRLLFRFIGSVRANLVSVLVSCNGHWSPSRSIPNTQQMPYSIRAKAAMVPSVEVMLPSLLPRPLPPPRTTQQPPPGKQQAPSA